MKSSKTFISFLFILAVAIVLVRPAVIYSSNTLQTLFTSIEGKAYGIRNLIKKRKETVRIGNIITKEVENITLVNNLLAFFLLANKKLLRNLLFALSFLLSQLTSLNRKKGTLFEIIADNHHYLALSVIRI